MGVCDIKFKWCALAAAHGHFNQAQLADDLLGGKTLARHLMVTFLC
jgi:hypothetical protein